MRWYIRRNCEKEKGQQQEEERCYRLYHWQFSWYWSFPMGKYMYHIATKQKHLRIRCSIRSTGNFYINLRNKREDMGWKKYAMSLLANAVMYLSVIWFYDYRTLFLNPNGADGMRQVFNTISLWQYKPAALCRRKRLSYGSCVAIIFMMFTSCQRLCSMYGILPRVSEDGKLLWRCDPNRQPVIRPARA